MFRKPIIIRGLILLLTIGVWASLGWAEGEKQNLETQKKYSREDLKKRILKEKDRVPIWIEFLKDPSWVVRAGVIKELSQSKDPRAIEPLAKVMLEDPDKGIRGMTAKMLSGFDDKRIVPIFKKQVLENGKYKILGATVLMKLGNEEEKKIALDILEKHAEEGHPRALFYETVISDGKRDIDVKRTYYNENNAKKILKKLLNHKDEVVRARAVYHLFTDLDDKKTAELKIEDILNSDNPRVRNIGKAILEQIGDKKSKKRLEEMEHQEMLRELKEAEQKRRK